MQATTQYGGRKVYPETVSRKDTGSKSGAIQFERLVGPTNSDHCKVVNLAGAKE